jgi:hypothetical protein
MADGAHHDETRFCIVGRGLHDLIGWPRHQVRMDLCSESA